MSEASGRATPTRHAFYQSKRPSVSQITGVAQSFDEDDDQATKMNIPAVIAESDHPIIAAVEAGGTSFVVAICEVTSPSATILPTIVHRQEFDSSQPAQCLDKCAQFLRDHKPAQGYHALGIASFGPLGVHKNQPETYGHILNSSPKAVWRGVDILTPLKKACQGRLPLRVKVDTDVNAPAYAEHLLRKNKAMTSTAYITVGTGIGVGLVVNGEPVHGRMHPEGGHVPVQPLKGDTFGGYSWNDTSPFGGVNTVEGLACSVALTERYQKMTSGNASATADRSILKDLPDDHEVWDHAANALANLCATLLLTLSMEQIVLGGGLMNRPGLLDKIRQRTLQLLNGYLVLPSDLSTIIRTSQFKGDAGLMGTIVLAQSALLDNDKARKPREAETKIKQEAYQFGLVHGMLVGAVGTALLCKYVWMPRTTRR